VAAALAAGEAEAREEAELDSSGVQLSSWRRGDVR
jgi:hypothetical protein